MKNILSFSLLFLFTVQIFAQKHQFLQVPKLTDEDVKSTKSTLKADAAAEILYNSYHNRVDYQGVMYMDVISRVKIYDKDKATDYLNKEISIYIGGTNREKLLELKAFTYNFEDGKLKVHRILTMNRGTYPKEKYQNYVDFRKKTANFDNTKVLITKL